MALFFLVEAKTIDLPLSVLVVTGLFIIIILIYIFIYVRYTAVRKKTHQLESENNELKNEIARMSKAIGNAQELAERRATFIANTSNEIRTPLNAIYGFAELLSERDVSGKDQQDYVDMIFRNANILLSIINDIIDITKIEKGLLNINTDQLNLNLFIDEMERYLKKEIRIRDKKLINVSSVKYLNDESSCFYVDSKRLQQIMINLINNALKFTWEGFIEIGYKLLEDEFLLFFVSDSGIGIEKKYQKSIFDEFTQIRSIDPDARSGSGLGLAISKKLTEIMGGKMWVESVVDSGSTFYFTIPCDPCSQRVKIRNDKPEVFRHGCWADRTVLIVDDYRDIYYYFSETLVNTGVRFLYADSGQRAIDLCKEHPEIELVLMDIQMPGMSGIEATSIIRRFRNNLPIIAQTAYAQPDDFDSFLDAGFNDLITKPIEKASLLQKMSKYLNK